MKRGFLAIMLSLSTGLWLLVNAPGLEARPDSKEADRLNNSALVMKEAMGMPSRIPQGLLDKAYCVIVIPSVLKGAFGVGGSYGRGAMSCRGGEDFKGPWSPPTMMALEGGSAGFQVGGQATLDVYMRTTILSYSRSRGLFAGVSLEGSTLRPDNKANKRLYGKEVSAKGIVLDGAVPTPPSAEKLISMLNQYAKNPATTSASAHTASSPTSNRPPVGSCYADPVEVISGSGNTVLVRADASDPDNDPLTYTWTAAAGTIEGNGSQVHWNPAGAAVGAYSITVRVDDGRGGTVSCVAQVLVAARQPTLSCSASPSSVHPGDRVHITASASNPSNDPLTFAWQSSGGRIVGSGPEVELDTTGIEPSHYTVTGQINDGRGGTADCRAEFSVEAPPHSGTGH